MSQTYRPHEPGHPTEATLAVVMLPEDANPDGFVHGGAIMKLADTAAGVCAARYARCRVATVAVENMTFLSPAQIGDVITVHARLVRVGRTSMTIEVEVCAEGRMYEQVRQTSTGRFTFVALDSIGRPTPVPPLHVLEENTPPA
jgi:acyl-CoA thioesterase YciA